MSSLIPSPPVCLKQEPGFALCLDERGVWFSRSTTVFFQDFATGREEKIGSVGDKKWRTLAMKNRIAYRLIRGGLLSLLPLSDDRLLATTRGTIHLKTENETDFRPVLYRGGVSWKLEKLPDGTIYAAEYFYNRQRREVEILASEDGGETWSLAYRFEPGEIRHIHSLCFDPFENQLIVATGDLDSESRILATNDRFHSIRVLAAGTQTVRTVGVVPQKDGFWYATDTPFEQNYAHFLTRSGSITESIPLSGSGLSICGFGDSVFIGTAFEHSPVNFDHCAKLYRFDGTYWQVWGSWHEDGWSAYNGAYFQMARVILPRIFGTPTRLAATPVAVKNADGQMFQWEIR